MRKGRFRKKILPALMTAAMVMSLMPATAFAVTTSDQIRALADDTYNGTAKVSDVDDAEAEMEEWEWEDYTVSVTVTVKDGAITEIDTSSTNVPSESTVYWKKATVSTSSRTSVIEKIIAANSTNVDTVSGATYSSEAIKLAVDNALKDYVTTSTEEEEEEEEETSGDVYVLMNIPYEVFYTVLESENFSADMDAVSAATSSKYNYYNLAGGAYNSGDADIDGVTYCVKLTEDEYAELQETDYVVVDESAEAVEVVSNRTAYEISGIDTLFVQGDYAYAVVDAQSNYLTATIDDGEVTITGSVLDTETTVTGITYDFTTDTTYGDYELDVDIENYVSGMADVAAVTVNTTDGSEYGLLHVEEAWTGGKLAWSTGHTTTVHNNVVQYQLYAGMEGKTIESVTYYMTDGTIYVFELASTVYVPYTLDIEVEVDDAEVEAGSTTVSFSEDLPDNFEASYSVEGLTVTYSDGTLTYETDGVLPGSYTLTITDESGTYAALTADFVLSGDLPAEYNEDDDNPALVQKEGATEAEYENYISNITTVTVNGTSYSASGRGSVTIVNEDGTIDTTQFVVDGTGTYEITVTSTGYEDYTFVYTVPTTSEDDTTGDETGGSDDSATKDDDDSTTSGDDDSTVADDDDDSTTADDDSTTTSDEAEVTDNTDTGDSGMTAYLFILMLCAGLAVVEIMRRRYASEK